ncbi:hypothetical protein HDV00_003277 [Rhizophlyctis rosea]|nr:hypothetical protein HDV00_003277 [Rhizophlyctis rosea]
MIANFNIAVPPSEADALRDAVGRDPGIFYWTIASIKSEDCVATKEDDLVAIKQAISESVGFAALDGMVLSVLFIWMSNALNSHPKAAETGNGGAGNWLRNSGPRVQYGPEKWDEVERLLLECRERAVVTLGEEHPMVLMATSQLAGLYVRQGKYDTAEPLYEDCVERTKRAMHGEAFIYLFNLGTLYRIRQKDQAARSIFVDGLQRALLSGDRVSELMFVEGLARLSHENTPDVRFRKPVIYNPAADPIFEDIVASWRHTLGGDAPRTLTAANELAGLIADRGNLSAAEWLYVECFERRKRILGPTHWDTLATAKGLMVLYKRRGKTEEAEALYRGVMETVEEARSDNLANGWDDRENFPFIRNLAGLFSAHGNSEEAEDLLEDCWERIQRLEGQERLLRASVRDELGDLYERLGKFEKAETLYTRQLDESRATSEADAEEAAIALHKLAKVHERPGQYGKAGAMYQECIKIRRQILGDEHPETLCSLAGFGRVSRAQGQFEEADAIMAQCVLVGKRVLGGDHEDILEWMEDLAFIKAEQRQYHEARLLLEECIEITQRMLGENQDTHRLAEQLALGLRLETEVSKMESQSMIEADVPSVLSRMKGKARGQKRISECLTQ